MAKDRFPNELARQPYWPSHEFYEVTPHDTNELDPRPCYLRANTAGALRMKTATSDITIDVVAGEVIDARPTIVHTDTTAEIHAFW
jgi:hypothetical protein